MEQNEHLTAQIHPTVCDFHLYLILVVKVNWDTSEENSVNESNFIGTRKRIVDADVTIITLALMNSYLHPAPFYCYIIVLYKAQLRSKYRNSTLSAPRLLGINKHNRNLCCWKNLFWFDKWPSPSAQKTQ